MKEPRQAEILKWAEGAFGPIALNGRQRVLRFVEEAIELAHARQLTRDDLAAIIDRVYSRPCGHVRQEIAQCGLTLECLAEFEGIHLDTVIGNEFERVRSIPDADWKARHEAKREQGILE